MQTRPPSSSSAAWGRPGTLRLPALTPPLVRQGRGPALPRCLAMSAAVSALALLVVVVLMLALVLMLAAAP